MLATEAEKLDELLRNGYHVNYTAIRNKNAESGAFMLTQPDTYVTLYPDTSPHSSQPGLGLHKVRFLDSNGDYHYYTEIYILHVFVYPPNKSIDKWLDIKIGVKTESDNSLEFLKQVFLTDPEEGQPVDIRHTQGAEHGFDHLRIYTQTPEQEEVDICTMHRIYTEEMNDAENLMMQAAEPSDTITLGFSEDAQGAVVIKKKDKD